MPLPSYQKRPKDAIQVVFDFRPFVAAVAPSFVTFALKSQPGIFIEQAQDPAYVYTLTIYGGKAGRHYVFGIEATSVSGMSKLDLRRLRVREAITSVAAAGVLPPSFFVLFDEMGNVLVDAEDNALIYEEA